MLTRPAVSSKLKLLKRCRQVRVGVLGQHVLQSWGFVNIAPCNAGENNPRRFAFRRGCGGCFVLYSWWVSGLQIVEDDLWLVVCVVVVGECDERGDSFREHCGFDFLAGFDCALFYDVEVKMLCWYVGF